MYLHKDYNKLDTLADIHFHPGIFSPIWKNPYSKKIEYNDNLLILIFDSFPGKISSSHLDYQPREPTGRILAWRYEHDFDVIHHSYPQAVTELQWPRESACNQQRLVHLFYTWLMELGQQ